MPERVLEGWKAIADMFACHPRTMQQFRKELFSCGVLFYRLRYHTKSRKRHRVVCAFPSMLREWMSLRARRGMFFSVGSKHNYLEKPEDIEVWSGK